MTLQLLLLYYSGYMYDNSHINAKVYFMARWIIEGEIVVHSWTHDIQSELCVGLISVGGWRAMIIKYFVSSFRQRFFSCRTLSWIVQWIISFSTKFASSQFYYCLNFKWFFAEFLLFYRHQPSFWVECEWKIARLNIVLVCSTVVKSMMSVRLLFMNMI